MNITPATHPNMNRLPVEPTAMSVPGDLEEDVLLDRLCFSSCVRVPEEAALRNAAQIDAGLQGE